MLIRSLSTLFVNAIFSYSSFLFFGFSYAWPVNNEFFPLSISIIYSFFHSFKLDIKAFFLSCYLILIAFKLIRILIA